MHIRDADCMIGMQGAVSKNKTKHTVKGKMSSGVKLVLDA